MESDLEADEAARWGKDKAADKEAAKDADSSNSDSGRNSKIDLEIRRNVVPTKMRYCSYLKNCPLKKEKGIRVT